MKQTHGSFFWRLVENENHFHFLRGHNDNHNHDSHNHDGHKSIIQNFVMRYRKNSYKTKKKERKKNTTLYRQENAKKLKCVLDYTLHNFL